MSSLSASCFDCRKSHNILLLLLKSAEVTEYVWRMDLLYEGLLIHRSASEQNCPLNMVYMKLAGSRLRVLCTVTILLIQNRFFLSSDIGDS